MSPTHDPTAGHPQPASPALEEPKLATSGMLAELIEYVGFTCDDARLLLRMGPAIRLAFPDIVREFYDTIDRTPGARRVFSGTEQRQRLERTLYAWMEGLIAGRYDEPWFEQRSRIGRMHVRIDLSQRYMLTSMNLVRAGMHAALGAQHWPSEEASKGHRALDRILDIELAIMLETYRESYLERQRASERLAAIGQIAASIGHELRNPLAVMETSLHLLERKLADEKALRHAKRIGEQLAVSGTIISDLLEMARDRPPERVSVDVAALVENARAGVPVPEGVEIRISVASDIARATFDRGQLRQVLVNLMQNGAQAIARGPSRRGTVEVRVTRDDRTLVIVVEDEGPGLSLEARANLFQALFTTSATGFGLGLALVKRVIDAHGGTVIGDNGPRGGARFEIRLPDAME